MEAASGGFVDVGRVLLDKGADVNAPPVPSSRDTALTIAADKGHYRFVELLLSRGAQVDVRNKKGNSSLWLAANGGHLDVVQLLHSAGADIDSQDNRKVSCLMAAFRKGHSKVVKWMVKHVSQFPSDTELTRYIATVSDKDLLKKCHTCMEIIRVAKERQAAEAAKNASSLLEELDREKNMEESKKAAAARKREKKKRKKLEKLAERGLLPAEEENKENNADDNMDDVSDVDVDSKEKTPDHIIMGGGSNSSNQQDSGIDANSQSSESSSAKTRIMDEQPFKTEKEVSPKPEIESKKTISKAKKNKKNKSEQQQQNSDAAAQQKSKQQEVNGGEPTPSSMPAAIIPKPEVVTPRPEVIAPKPETSPNVASKDSQQQSNNKKARASKQASPGGTAATSAKNKKSGPSATGASPAGNGSSQTGNATGASTGNTPATGPPPDAGWKEVVRKSKKVSVPANAISRVIGRGGCNINAIREMSGAHIEVEKLQGKASQQTERTILIKGSAEATRQANTWIQQIIASPDKDMTDILGKNYLNTKALNNTIQSTVIVNSKVNSGKVTPVQSVIPPSVAAIVTPVTSTPLPISGVNIASNNNPVGGVAPIVVNKKPATVTPTPSAAASSIIKPNSVVVNSSTLASAPSKSKPSSSTFAAVASGESYGMIQTGGTHPGSLAKVQKAKSPDNILASNPVSGGVPTGPVQVPVNIPTGVANAPLDDFGTFEAPKIEPVAAKVAANLENKDYSPFKSFTGWTQQKADTDTVSNVAVGKPNFVGAVGSAPGLSNDNNDLAHKAPGYRISPSGGPLFPAAPGSWSSNSSSGVSVAAISSSVNMSSINNSIMTSTAQVGLYSSMERSNSAPGSPILAPIGSQLGVAPGSNQVGSMGGVTKMGGGGANTTSPGSEPDYRTGSSLSSGIGLSPGSIPTSLSTGGPVGGRSLTPDNDISMKTLGHGIDKDLFVGTSGLANHGRPASSGSANAGGGGGGLPFMVNPENIINAAAQMASVGFFSGSNFSDDLSVALPPQTSTKPPTVDFQKSFEQSRYNMQPPTSKLNPNAPDFMRPPITSTTASAGSMRSQMINKNNNGSNSGFNNTRFNNRYVQ